MVSLMSCFTGAMVRGNTFGPGTGPILRYQVNCVGSESFLDQCPANTVGINCAHSNDVGISCLCKFI